MAQWVSSLKNIYKTATKVILGVTSLFTTVKQEFEYIPKACELKISDKRY